MTPGIGPVWGLLLAGAVTQATVELMSASRLPARTAAIGLILVLLAVNSISSRHRRVQATLAAFLLLAALPLWIMHARSVLAAYGVPSPLPATVSPALLAFGTLLRFLLRSDPTRP